MWEKIVNLAISNGLWAVLFLALFVYQLRDSHTRERKYQAIIDSLGKSLAVVNDVKNDVEDIKRIISARKVKGEAHETTTKN